MTRITAAVLGTALALACVQPAAAGPRGVLYMGLGDWLFAGPLLDLRGELVSRGAVVAVRPWWLPTMSRLDFAAGQSAGVGPASRARARCRVGIDPVRIDWRGIQVNFWTPWKLGYPPGRALTRARNIRIDGATHVTLPAVAKRRIADVLMGGCR